MATCPCASSRRAGEQQWARARSAGRQMLPQNCLLLASRPPRNCSLAKWLLLEAAAPLVMESAERQKIPRPDCPPHRHCLPSITVAAHMPAADRRPARRRQRQQGPCRRVCVCAGQAAPLTSCRASTAWLAFLRRCWLLWVLGCPRHGCRSAQTLLCVGVEGRTEPPRTQSQ